MDTSSSENKFCINCGKYSHDIRKCTEPTISIGIILIHFDHKEMCEIFNNITMKKTKIENNNEGININSVDDIDIFSILQQTVKFMIICRRFTLGFSEFIRGRYSINNVEEINKLFQQMTKNELELLAQNKNSLDKLWDIFWGDTGKKIIYNKDFEKSRAKFEALTNPNRCEVTMDFYIKNTIPIWTCPEWGFPKGRRNKMETDFECAKREFEEETMFDESDYIVVNDIEPLVEDFDGTNGIKYRHIYYIGYATNDKQPFINGDNHIQSSEIGNIGYFSYNEIINMFRPHHKERKNILTKLYIHTCQKIIAKIQMRKNCVGQDENILL